ncbi:MULTISPECIES: phosphotransferase enzyme family protein [Paenibacillus]|uniref:phosphotransferase enzyme family protein n=1 Tax=Paenibacillus TaxID=44249 RepID=UPI000883C029|nr:MULTISPECIES: phosphotransferase [Paenibacillus]MCL6658596.1 phosphotransferase [Paenibacillus amylolyticus]SDC60608.1 Ser/Thr protein kinase RdoA involved in Cpx stress response, MazF antagonist [Paenibacillus sp. CF095]
MWTLQCGKPSKQCLLEEIIINFNEAVIISNTHVLALVSELFDLEGYNIQLIPPHEGGRNVVYTCEQEGRESLILRVSFLPDRKREDYIAELEYVRYLFEHGASVSNVVSSKKGFLLEEITYDEHTFFVCMFVKAKGKLLVENHYQYREGVPLTEYYYNSGKVLGKMHQLSKGYTPVHRRHHLIDNYSGEYIDNLVPESFPLLKEKMVELLNTLQGLDTNQETFGMIHFDYNDGNYSIDFDTGQITVYDFDNSCFGWYMYDLADLWTHGVGWVQFEPDADKRRQFMDDYFQNALAGYTSETKIEDSMLEKLPLFIQVTLLENILGQFEEMQRAGEEPEADEALLYLIKCLEEDIPYKGFFHEMYSTEAPFEYEGR